MGSMVQRVTGLGDYSFVLGHKLLDRQDRGACALSWWTSQSPLLHFSRHIPMGSVTHLCNTAYWLGGGGHEFMICNPIAAEKMITMFLTWLCLALFVFHGCMSIFELWKPSVCLCSDKVSFPEAAHNMPYVSESFTKLETTHDVNSLFSWIAYLKNQTYTSSLNMWLMQHRMV
jgi:hypothetical protein